MNKYDLIFITTQPAFYKINLYNEISKKKKILVIFIAEKSEMRTPDFGEGNKKFEYKYLTKENYEKRNKIKSILNLLKILFKVEYKRIVLGGWDSLENWMAWLITNKKKSALVVESSEYESTNKGLKGLMKKIYVKKISLVFVSGESQKNLLKNIGYKNKIVKTKGVGIFNYINKKIANQEIKQVKNFLYVGRLSSEKNIEQLIRVFNELSNLNLNIVGYGPLEKKLKDMANKNINFLGKIKNEELNKIYQENQVLILPSKSEAWGLVVEEALYNGIPVILSNKVGCAREVIEENIHGLIYNVDLDSELKKNILKILDIKNYISYKSNIKKLDFQKIKENQINSYIEEKNEF